ncbi:hypothetical protein [Escherichia coli]|uniref:hypothetical protein n=1 Tax=Escherichia coli TaxID=562 RepID=UPI00397FC01B
MRAGGRNPDEVKRRRKAEIDENSRLGLVFDTDPSTTKEATVPELNDSISATRKPA